jgi:hypothetical protein
MAKLAKLASITGANRGVGFEVTRVLGWAVSGVKTI